MQKPSKWRFSADFYFSSKLAQTLQIDWKWTYQHCPGIFYLIWALFLRNKLCKTPSASHVKTIESAKRHMFFRYCLKHSPTLCLLYASVAQQRCARSYLASGVGVRRSCSRTPEFFFFSKPSRRCRSRPPKSKNFRMLRSIALMFFFYLIWTLFSRNKLCKNTE